ncbi:MAG: hypothetical protein H0W84_15030, partial [Bacteroidetes bacterium]|nr:hypothetical protein [Bacteroidota bacterium]
AKLSMIEFGGSFNYERGSYSFTISGNKGLFGSLIAGKTLQDLSLPKILYSGTSRNFATNVMKGLAGYNQYPYMKFAPAAIQNFFDTSRPDYNNEFLVLDVANNIVVTGSSPDDWEFGRPSIANSAIAALSGTAAYMDHRTIPFFNYKWIIQKLFQQFGYTITGEWMDDANWDDCFMFNNFAIEKYDLTAHTDINREIQPERHLPKKAIGTFLRDLQFFFNVKFSFRDGNNVSMDYRKSALHSTHVMDTTAITGHIFTGTLLDYKQKGFTLAFAFDSADNYPGEHIKEIDPKKLVATINRYADFSTLVIGRPFEYNDLVYVAAENQYYAYSNGAGVTAWEYYSEKLGPYIIGPGEYRYESGISPMATYLFYDTNIDKLVNKDMIAAGMPGSYYNKNYKLIEAPFDTRIFYISKFTKSGVNLPTSFVHNRDRNNNLRKRISLAWYGPEGLYETLWKDWLNFLMNTRLVKTTLALDQKSYGDFNKATKIRIAGTHYLPHQATVSIPLHEEAQVVLYRL